MPGFGRSAAVGADGARSATVSVAATSALVMVFEIPQPAKVFDVAVLEDEHTPSDNILAAGDGIGDGRAP